MKSLRFFILSLSLLSLSACSPSTPPAQPSNSTSETNNVKETPSENILELEMEASVGDLNKVE